MFAFLAEDAHGVPWLKTHHHRELEINLVVRGSVTYVIGQSCCTFPQGELFWLFPGQPHRLVRSCCHSAENQLLLDERPPRNAVLHYTLSPSAFSLVCQRISSVMEGGRDAVTLNREAGFGLSPDFCYEHRNPNFLNAGLAQLLLFCWGRQRASADLERAVRLHQSVLKALEIIRGESSEVDFENMARQCGGVRELRAIPQGLPRHLQSAVPCQHRRFGRFPKNRRTMSTGGDSAHNRWRKSSIM